MTIPDLFLLATKAVQGIASLLEGQKRLESQNSAIIQQNSELLKRLAQVVRNSTTRRELALAKREIRTLHVLLNREIEPINLKPGPKPKLK